MHKDLFILQPISAFVYFFFRSNQWLGILKTDILSGECDRLKGCVRSISASLFFNSKRYHLTCETRKKKNYFTSQALRSREYQNLEF